MLDPEGRLLRPGIEVFLLVSVRLYRDGIADALRRDSRFRGRRQRSVARRHAQRDGLPPSPDVVLVDLDLAEGVGRRPRRCASTWPAASIVALAVREADEDIVSWAEAGVSGLVSRDATLVGAARRGRGRGHGRGAVPPAVAAALLRRVASLPREARAGRRAGRSRRASARSSSLIARRALEQGDRALAPHRARDGQEPRAPHPREARVGTTHRGRRRRARARRARTDLDPRSRRPGSEMNPKSDPAVHSRRRAPACRVAHSPEGGIRWSAPGSCSSTWHRCYARFFERSSRASPISRSSRSTRPSST